MFAVLLTPRAFSWSWRVQHWHWPHLTDVSRGLLETNLDPVHHDKHWWKDVRSFIHLKTVYMECIHVHVYIYTCIYMRMCTYLVLKLMYIVFWNTWSVYMYINVYMYVYVHTYLLTWFFHIWLFVGIAWWRWGGVSLQWLNNNQLYSNIHWHN